MKAAKTVQAALLCNSSDIPATRKVGGLVGHGVLKGCLTCFKSFPTDSFGTKADYSGFCRDEWPQRSVEEHRSNDFDWKNAKTLSCRHKIERDCGV